MYNVVQGCREVLALTNIELKKNMFNKGSFDTGSVQRKDTVIQ